MSVMSIRPYLPFCRVRLVRQSVCAQGDMAWLEAVPDARFRPICHVCGTGGGRVHRWDVRPVRDLNLGAARVWINCKYRTLYCPACRAFRVEDLEFFEAYQRVTKRLARYIHELCKVMTVQDVATHLGLAWRTVKRVDQAFLEEQFGATDYDGLRVLAVDEISIRKHHHYMTVVMDYLTGRVVWMGTGKEAETLKDFFRGMSQEQKEALEAIAMDMSGPYIKAVRDEVPHVKIVFDLFHVVQAFNKVIDRVRIAECRQAATSEKGVYRGSKYLLLSNRKNLRRPQAREHLTRLLALNKTLSTVMILKDLLKQIWTYRSREVAQRRLRQWCLLARTVPHPCVHKFADCLERHAYGILTHCDYPINTGKLEGTNNVIKVIKRKAYGFHDERYFTLKVKQRFSAN